MDELIITDNELVRALFEALSQPGGCDGMTTKELADACSMTIEKVRNGLHVLKLQDKLETVNLRRQNLAGIWTTVKGYSLKV
jgi:hypothetical protein